MVVFALAEPAVVHHKAIDADGRSFFRERYLPGFIDAEFGGFPRVVNHRTRLGIRRLRQDVSDFKTMQQARGAAEAVIGIAAVKNGRLEMFAGFQFVAKIEWIEAAGHAHGIQLSVFHGDAPGTGPRQRAKPDFAVLLVGAQRVLLSLGCRRGKSQTTDWLDGRWFRGGFR